MANITINRPVPQDLPDLDMPEAAWNAANAIQDEVKLTGERADARHATGENLKAAYDEIAGSIASFEARDGVPSANDLRKRENAKRLLDNHRAESASALAYRSNIKDLWRRVVSWALSNQHSRFVPVEVRVGKDTLESIYPKLAALNTKRAEIEGSLIPLEDQIAKIKRDAAALRARAPRAKLVARYAGGSHGKEIKQITCEIEFPTIAARDIVSGDDTNQPMVVDSAALYALLAGDAFDAKMIADLTEAYKGKTSMSASAKRDALAKLDAERLALERIEAALVWDSYTGGELPFPKDISIEAVLGVEAV